MYDLVYVLVYLLVYDLVYVLVYLLVYDLVYVLVYLLVYDLVYVLVYVLVHVLVCPVVCPGVCPWGFQISTLAECLYCNLLQICSAICIVTEIKFYSTIHGTKTCFDETDAFAFNNSLMLAQITDLSFKSLNIGFV